MRFARLTFLIAAVYGILILTPLFFLEPTFFAKAPLTHPEYFYGFLGSALVWQLAFLVLALDPARYRLLIPVAVLEKLAWVVALAILMVQGRTSWTMLPATLIDATLGILFLVAWFKARTPQPAAGKADPAARAKV